MILYTDLALMALNAKDGSADGGEGEATSSCPSSWLNEHSRLSPLPTTLVSRAAAGGGGGGGGGSGGGSTAAVPTLAAAREAWCAAARACERATAAGPRWRRRRRWRRPVGEDVEVDPVGGAGLVAISSFTLVLPPTVATDKVACPPAFSILWKTSNKRVSSSPIFASESEE